MIRFGFWERGEDSRQQGGCQGLEKQGDGAGCAREEAADAAAEGDEAEEEGADGEEETDEDEGEGEAGFEVELPSAVCID